MKTIESENEKLQTLNTELLEALKRAKDFLIEAGIELQIVHDLENTIAKAEGKQ